MSQSPHSRKIKRTLLPGQPGTKKLLAQYGDRLVCVRYRDDPDRHRKLTTVEVIVDERPSLPVPQRIPPNKRVCLKVAYGEVEIGRAIRSAGGEWDKDRKVWKLAYKHVVALGFTNRIVPEPSLETTA